MKCLKARLKAAWLAFWLLDGYVTLEIWLGALPSSTMSCEEYICKKPGIVRSHDKWISIRKESEMLYFCPEHAPKGDFKEKG